MGTLPDVLYTTLKAELNAFAHTSSSSSILSAPIIVDSDDVAVSMLLESILKKYLPPKPDPLLSEKAKALFLDCNARCSGVVRSRYIAQMRYLSEADFHDFPSWDQLLDLGRTGPGASVYSQGANSALEKLFINRMTTTSDVLYGEYRRYIRKYPDWQSAEICRVDLANERYSVVSGSKLSTVPKNCSIDRVICTEPSLNMFFQLALGEHINHVLRRSFRYDSAIQPDRNRRHAQRGSIDGVTATIDLKSASDTISLSLCEQILPAEVFAAILDCRSPATEVDGVVVPLNMVSSMGNGFTFPLQTYIFSLLIKAVCLTHNFRFESYDKGNFGVFGDDIIVPSAIYDLVVNALESLGFTVNLNKSFHGDHPFRESCGADFYNGINVRGVYCKSLQSDADRYSLANRLNRWSAMHKCPLPETIALLLPSRWRSFVVPSDMSDDSGYKTPSGALSPKGYRYSYLSPLKRIRQIFTKTHELRPFCNNPLGVMLLGSDGRLSSSGIPVRVADKRYVRSHGHSPFWAREIDLARFGVRFSD